ncbi:MAG: hypothetical protein NZ839_04760 [Endomicrobia bacterium]|nr:hypothetical protein [Endomicrobiia bacterium]
MIRVYSLNTKQDVLEEFYETKIKYKTGFLLLGSGELRYYLPKVPLAIGVEYYIGVKGALPEKGVYEEEVNNNGYKYTVQA